MVPIDDIQVQEEEPYVVQSENEQEMGEDPTAAQQHQPQAPQMMDLNDEAEEVEEEEQLIQLHEVENVPDIGAELEITRSYSCHSWTKNWP